MPAAPPEQQLHSGPNGPHRPDYGVPPQAYVRTVQSLSSFFYSVAVCQHTENLGIHFQNCHFFYNVIHCVRLIVDIHCSRHHLTDNQVYL